MQTLLSLVRYNAWANNHLFSLCQSAERPLLNDAAGGTTGSIEGTIAHLIRVEDAYLAMLQERDLEQSLGPRDAYAAHDLAWFAQRAGTIAESYRTLLSAQDEDWLDTRLQVPWFSFPMTKRDGVLQAVTHSAQHRAQVLSALGARGVIVPDLDYVLMLGERAGADAG